MMPAPVLLLLTAAFVFGLSVGFGIAYTVRIVRTARRYREVREELRHPGGLKNPRNTLNTIQKWP